METLLYITFLGIILLVGLICSIISRKIKIPNILLLIISGILLSFASYKGETIHFPTEFILVLGLITLIMVVFDSCSKFKLKELDTFSFQALKLTGVVVPLVIVFLGFSTKLIFNTNWTVSFIFASIMAGTSPDVVLSLIEKAKSRVVKFLEIESVINTPLIVLIPFIILDLVASFREGFVFEQFFDQFFPFLQQIIVGIGTGVVIGLIVFKFMRKTFSEKISSVAIIATALITYVLAENLKGNGVLAVTSLAIIFGNVTVKGKEILQRFSATFSNFLEILVFVLIGLVVVVPFDKIFLLKAGGIFGIYLLTRYIAVYITHRKKYNAKQLAFLTLNSPKGIATTVVVFLLTGMPIFGIEQILNLSLVIIIYSIILSSFVCVIGKNLINPKPQTQ